ncbi:MAG: metallophosphoesterase family protein [Verrucomicrobium sp.]|nr:metallophosphoesterase family protein [Verrucomicrobium sp.]
MRYGVFSDVHANLEALEAVVNDMYAQGVEVPVCLGDIVGYNADPGACLDRIRALDGPVVRGNHDQEAVGGHPATHFNALAEAGVAYSRKQLSLSQKFYLVELPLQLRLSGFSLVHASQRDPEGWEYVTHAEAAAANLAVQETPLCFFGHTHVPHLFAQEPGGRVAEYFYQKAELDPLKRYFVNVGSVGQPRDGDWRASYAIYDSTAQTLELRRIPYAIERAQAKIVAAGLPPELAERLRRAR